MRDFVLFISRILYIQEIMLRGLIVILLTFIMFLYFLLLIPFLHIYKFFKSGLEAVDECNAKMTESIQNCYKELKQLSECEVNE